jgi:hypothetical protein
MGQISQAGETKIGLRATDHVKYLQDRGEYWNKISASREDKDMGIEED